MAAPHLLTPHHRRQALPIEGVDDVRLRWMISLRWAGLLSQLVVVVASASMMIGADAMVGVVLVVGALSNVFVHGLLSSPRRPSGIAEPAVAASIAIDIISLTVLLGLSGGPLNPFTFFYVVHVTTAAVALSLRTTVALTAMATIGYGVLFLPGVFDPETHMQLMHGPAFMVHVRGMWLAFAVTAIFIVVFVSRLRRTLSDRDARLAEIGRIEERARRLASLATLAGGAAHELATPLGTIALVIDDLQRSLAQTTVAETVRDDIGVIQSEIARCKAVLAALARDAGTPGGEVLTDIATDTLMAEVVAGLDRVRLHTRSRAIVHAPHRALSAGLRGLVKNALQASSGDVVVDVDDANDDVLITITDVGPGISDEVLARLGEPFFTTKGPGDGMGLGLFLATTVVDAIGGTLAIGSVAGRGTTVTARLPTRSHVPL